MIELPSLYPHQQDQIARVRQALGKGPAIIAANPGVGKTRMAKWIMGSAANKPVLEGFTGRSVFCVHRRSLVDNASQSFLEEPRLPHGIIMSGVETNWRERVQVGSIDTMVSWYVGEEYEGKATFDLVVFDECHSHNAKLSKWLESHNKQRAELGLKPTVVVGLSATPQAKGLGDVYKSIVTGPPADWLIDNGFLSRFSYMKAVEGRLGLLVKKGPEFTAESQEAAFGGLGGDLVRDWISYAKGRPTVGFFPRLTHAKEAMGELIKSGVNAEYVDGKTPDDRRQELFRMLGDGTIDYICNVGVIERGTNIPAVSCVQLCLAVGSVVRFKQMVGRGSRVHPGKSDCCVARDTLILTDRGEVPIQDVRLTDRIWDGVEFCCHDGAYCTGTKAVIEWCGLTLTPDHKVLTNDGWKEAQAAKVGQWRPVSGGLGGSPVWTTDHSNPHYPGHKRKPRSGGRLLALWQAGVASVSQHFTEATSWMRTLYAEVWAALPGMGLAPSSASTATVPMPSEPGIFSLWRTRDRISVCLNLRRSMLDSEAFGPSAKQVVDDRPYRRGWPLRAGQLAMGDDADAVSQSGVCLAREVASEVSICKVLRRSIRKPPSQRHDSETDCGQVAVEVWDIRNVGPRNRYCANGLIIANCVLDHGGNVKRHGFFEDEIEWVLEATSTEVRDHQVRPSITCPRCKRVYRGGTCQACGYAPTARERLSQGLEFDGSELVPVDREKKKQKGVKTNEEILIESLFRAGFSNRTWRQACGIAKGSAAKQGTTFRCPKTFEVGGKTYNAIPFGHPDGSRRVGMLFDFVQRQLQQERHNSTSR